MKKTSTSLTQRLQYLFDNFMSRGSTGLIIALGIASSLVVLLSASLIYLAGAAPVIDGAKPGFPSLIWLGLMHIIDQGTITGSSGSLFYLAVMLLVTAGGLFVLSVLISIITTALSDKLEELRDGRSKIIEEGHVVILGWSQQVFPTICELVEGKNGNSRLRIVVMGIEEKVEMDRQISQRLREWAGRGNPESAKRRSKLKKTRIITRRGNPADLQDILIPDISNSRSVIIHSPESDNSDIQVIKTLMGIRKIYYDHTEEEQEDPPSAFTDGNPIIIAELQEPKNHSLVKSLQDKLSGNGMSGWVIHKNDVISKIITQTCRQKGLSDVLQEIISFEGNEIYFHIPEPVFINKTFQEVINAYENGVVLGVWEREKNRHHLNPPSATLITPEMIFILLCEEDPSCTPLRIRRAGSISHAGILPRVPEKQPEHTLVLGWSALTENILQQLDEYVLAGSTALVAADGKIIDPEIVRETLERLSGRMKNLSVSFINADGTSPLQLEELKPVSYNRVLVLAYSEDLEIQKADAVTLITLMHLRDIEKKAGIREKLNDEKSLNYSVIAEMLDNRNRDLAENAGYSDFIVSDRLLSLMVAQFTGDRRRADIFQELFSAEGCEIYLKPIDLYYPEDPQEVTFDILSSAAFNRREIALGYVSFSERDRGLPGVHLNPEKNDSLPAGRDNSDRLIVVARAV